MTKRPLGVLFFSLYSLIIGIVYLIMVLTGTFEIVFPKPMNILNEYFSVIYALVCLGGIILAVGLLKAQTWAWVMVMILQVAWITFYSLAFNGFNVLFSVIVLFYFLIPGVRTYFKIPEN